MIAVLIGDETIHRKKLERLVKQSEVVTNTISFDNEKDFLEWAKNHDADLVLLDLRSDAGNGMELSGKLIELHPKRQVIVYTGFEDFSQEESNIKMEGYLIKPVQENEIGRELQMMQSTVFSKNEIQLEVNVYGAFEVFDRNGKSITFRRKKTKELLAVLIDQEGKILTPWEIADRLWYGEHHRWSERNQNYFYTLVSVLKRTLKDAGADGIIVREAEGYHINMMAIRIRPKENGTAEYMSGYQWARKTKEKEKGLR